MSERVHFIEGATEETYKDALRGLRMKAPVIVKPNWGCSSCFTEAEILDWTLSAIDGEKLVVESYGWARSEEFITTGKFGSKNRSALRKSDRWFLDHSGVGPVLEKHDTRFLNITEEYWKGRVADAAEMRALVESEHNPVALERMYGEVPEELYSMRGGTLLSLSKLKRMGDPYHVSLSVKNLFGMIPGPGRYSPYHGKKDCNLAQSVLDINKIYRSMFDVKGVVEGILTGETVDFTSGTSRLFEGLQLAWCADSPVELDAFVATQLEVPPDSVGYLSHVAGELGSWSARTIRDASERSVAHLFPAPGS